MGEERLSPVEESVTVDAIEVAEQREAELRAILDSMPDAVYIGGAEGMTLVNQAALDQLGFATREELNRSVAVLANEIDVRDAETGELVPPEEQVFSRALRGERAVSFVRVRHRLTGERRLVRSAASPVLLDGRVIAAVAVNTDVTEQWNAQAALHDSEERHAFLLKLSDTLRPLTLANEIPAAAAQVIGEALGVDRAYFSDMREEEQRGFAFPEYIRNGGRSISGWYDYTDFQEIVPGLKTGQPFVIPNVRTSDKLSERTKESYATLQIEAFVSISLIKQGEIVLALTIASETPRAWTEREITLLYEAGERTWDAVQRGKVEAELRASLAEKESLLSEVHHRVKNNLQVITSLLHLQSRGPREEEVRHLFQETLNRVQSIASIHELLYRSKNFAQVDLLAYVQQLVPGLVRFYGASARVQVQLEGGSAGLNLERAVPFGLLLNELISNALRHGLPEPESGSLYVELKGERDLILLKVRDTGRGLPPGSLTEGQESSLGLKLVHLLVQQLNGTVEFHSEAGTTVYVEIPARTGASSGETIVEESTADRSTTHGNAEPSTMPNPHR